MRPTEKFRARTFDELVGEAAGEIQRQVELHGRDIPHLLLYGPPGTGKTSTASAVALALNGDLDHMTEYNASDERGIETVREIEASARHSWHPDKQRIVLLDEADKLTGDAQSALRRVMERVNATFILTANERWKILRALQSRCYAREFGQLTTDDIVLRLRDVAPGLSESALERIAEQADGDMRPAIQQAVLDPAADIDGPQTTESSGSVESVAAGEVDADPADVTTCLAIESGSGERCPNSALEDDVVCGHHRNATEYVDPSEITA